MENKEHKDLMKVKQIHYERIEICIIELRPLKFYYYLK